MGEVVTRLLPQHGGSLVKSLGDGLMLEFESVPPAIQCALAMQQAIQPHNHGRASEQWMCLRIGAHVVDVVVDERDIYGSGVNLAARLAALAGPGDMVVSAEVRDELVPGVDADVEDLGPCYLKHLSKPVLAFRVGPAEQRPSIVVPRLEAMTTGPLPFVAVLPLQGQGVSEAHSAVGEIVADNLIMRLCGGETLRVISRLSTSALTGRQETIQRIGALLGASFVVSGTYRIAGEQLLVMVELAAVSTQEVVWAERFSGSLNDVANSGGDLTDSLCAGVFSAVSSHELRRVQTHPLPSLQGASLQLAATALLHRSSESEFERGREVLEYLVGRYPRAPIPRAWLAKWYVLRMTRGWVKDLPKESSLALDQTRRALDAAPDCSLAMAMEGFVRCHMLRDLDGAVVLLDQALVLNPNESWAWLFKCVVQGFRGEGELALSSAERAVELSPLDPMRHYYDGLAASAALAAKRLPLAIEWAQRSLRVSCAHVPSLRVLAIAQMESGDGESASRTIARVLALDKQFTVRDYLARAPAGGEATRQRYAQALRDGGVPLG